MAQSIPFVKMQGVGNDFVVVAQTDLGDVPAAEAALKMCARHFGVGSDGLLIVGPTPHPAAAFRFQMHNPDGTSDMCGNGLRCAALYAHHLGLLPPDANQFFADTPDGLLEGAILQLGNNDRSAKIRFEMATPRLLATDIPFTGIAEDARVIDFKLPLPARDLTITAINTGSTHTIAFVDELPGDDEFFALSPLVENHPLFPERTSILWTKRESAGDYAVRIWERGAGETLGCGTGACAVAVAAILHGLDSSDQPLSVKSRGGELSVEWPITDGPTWLTGPAEWVFEGQFQFGS